jgi:RNA polymerase sigma factor (sigma-70 family)
LARCLASDAVAEAFAQLLRRGMDVVDPERWLWRAAFNIARGDLASRRSLRPLDQDGGSYELEVPAQDLVDALRHLSPLQRAAVVLHHSAGYSTREVADIVGSTPMAVKVHLHRGRRRLRDLLQEEDR